MNKAPSTTAQGRYTQLESSRHSILERARECAKLTIPSLMPPSGHSETSTLTTPYQGLGARGVNTLSAKLLLALLPPNSPFFRLLIDDFALLKLTGRDDMRSEIEKALGQIERSVMGEIESIALRVSAFEALKQLLVAGNVVIHLTESGAVRVFRLDRFVVKRDPMGNVLELIIKEDISPDNLPEIVRASVIKNQKSNETSKSVALYTRIVRGKDQWDVSQEVGGYVIPGTHGTYPLDKLPWIVLRFTKIDGEDYGRSYVEEYLGDIRSLENLSKAIVDGSMAAAKVVFLVNPNGTTRAEVISKSESGDVKPGTMNDVTVLQMNKFADFRVAQETSAVISQRLSFAFLLNTAIQRTGERVTAEEIRYMAGELEDALGGTYSVLSQEFQLPLINVLMARMQKQKRLPQLPKGIVKPSIVTGLEALGRGHDMNKLQMFGRIAAEAANLPPEIDRGSYLLRAGTALGIDMGGLVKSSEQLAQEQQQAQMNALMEKLGPKGMDILRDQMSPQNGQSPEAPQAPQ